MASFLRYTGYLNFINGPISRVLLLILVHLQLLSCLFFCQIYPTELQLNKANSAPFLDLNLSITNGTVSSKIYDKRDDFNFEIVNFSFIDGDVPRSPSFGVYQNLYFMVI